ncbi:hypothetical protein P152DRAFT_9670 [Eremomyces bilateralis CBS 781.70]|uniref:Uncharacterized protein n=1 Tax=Eremomyces bilateralis CBS 781.70 TaxID=1392243 RepID=A0A6G1GGX1_9PEZI|nr:uncharacterized protein P152DRAFT_9670 [Eremomyces bilateralis CBS 781.70]KAF1817151.1 hypothetical protein P152DRAFT_9670 [Eremomyces bilateralis CBS 781.70]
MQKEHQHQTTQGGLPEGEDPGDLNSSTSDDDDDEEEPLIGEGAKGSSSREDHLSQTPKGQKSKARLSEAERRGLLPNTIYQLCNTNGERWIRELINTHYECKTPERDPITCCGSCNPELLSTLDTQIKTSQDKAMAAKRLRPLVDSLKLFFYKEAQREYPTTDICYTPY